MDHLTTRVALRILGLLVTSSALAVGACSGEPSKSASSATDDSAQCDARADELASWMRSLVDEGLRTDLVTPRWDLHELPADHAAVAVRPAPIVTISKEAISFLGEYMAETGLVAGYESDDIVGPLYHRIREEWALLCTWYSVEDGPQPGDLIVHAQPDVAWGVIRRVVATAYRAGTEVVAFPFHKQTAVTKPGPSTIDATIAEIEYRLQADWVIYDAGRPSEHPLDRAYAGCPLAYERLHAAWRSGSPAARGHFLTDVLPAAIRGCECDVDIEAIKALHWWWSGRLSRDGLITVGIDIPLTGDASARAIALPDDTPWSQAYAKIVEVAGQAGPFFFANDPSAAPRPVRGAGIPCTSACLGRVNARGECVGPAERFNAGSRR